MAVLASHVIFSAYGHWLPNDPRGSGSKYVGSKDLYEFGPATHLDDRSRSVARRPHDRRKRLAAKAALQRPAVNFTGIQARAVGRGFGEYVERAGLTVWACSILPDHMHLVVARHSYFVEQIVLLLKSAATVRLIEEGLHPFGPPGPDGEVDHCWARGEWKKFPNSEAEILDKIRYIEDNPVKEGKPRQQWVFVVPYPHRHPRSPMS